MAFKTTRLLVLSLALSSMALGQADDMTYVRKATIQDTFGASMDAAMRDAVRMSPWQAIGPFDSPDTKDTGRAVESRHPIDKATDFAAAWPGRNSAQLQWQAVQLNDGQVNDLSPLFKDAPCIVFLHRVIESTGEYELPVSMGNSGGLMVRVNGERAISRGGARKTRLGDEQFTVNLKKGRNDLVVKLAQEKSEAGFAFAAGNVAATPQYQARLLARIGQDFPPADVYRFYVELEWRRQWDLLTAQIRNRDQFKRLAPQTFRIESSIMETDRDPADIVLRRTAKLMADILALGERLDPKVDPTRMARARTIIADAGKQLDEIKSSIASTDVKAIDARKAFYTKLCAIRRRVAFANPLLDFDSLLFVKRERNPNSEGQGHHMCDQFFGFNVRNIPGGGVYVLQQPFSDAPVLKNMLANSTVESGSLAGRKMDFGSFLSPAISYDGRTILFAHSQTDGKARRWSEERSWHIFGVNIDGSYLHQITDGAWNDFDPCYMPDGRVVFISERRGGFGRCHGRPVPVYTLHTMNADGTNIQCISFHESNEWQPSINHDGMIVYTRWDYVDRHFNIAHHPWITTPDGRDARAIQGNYPPGGNWGSRPEMEMDIRAIPGSRRYIAVTGCHHGQSYGSIVIVDPNEFDDGAMGPLRRVTPESRFPESECDTRDQPFGTPWPLNEDYYLAVWDPASQNYGLYLVDSWGNKEFLYRDPGISCLSPIAIKPRPLPPVVPMVAQREPTTKPSMPYTSDQLAKVKQAAPYSIDDPDRGWAKPYEPLPDEMGEIVVVNVYDTRKAWPAGTQIKALRIVQPLMKSTPGADGPMIGVGSQSSARAILGTVPVESDGSVRFMAPIHRPLLFQAIDQNGLAVQSMRSDTYVMRGTRLVCKGCHEPAGHSPIPPTSIVALAKPPSHIKPDVDGTSPFNYPRLVQPVLDRNCVACHAKNAPKAMDLSAGKPEENRRNHGWFASYTSLAKDYGFWYANGDVSYHAFDGSGTTPGKFGAYGSKLYKLLMAGHYDVNLSPDDMHRLTIWLENNTAFYGDYQQTEAQAKGEVVRPIVE